MSTRSICLNHCCLQSFTLEGASMGDHKENKKHTSTKNNKQYACMTFVQGDWDNTLRSLESMGE